MITNNGKFIFGCTAKDSADGTRLKMFNGGDTTGYTRYHFYSNERVYVGTDTTQPTAEDYYMIPIDNLTHLGSSHTAPATYEDGFMWSCTSTYKNTTSSPVTVRELGYVVSSDSTFNTSDDVLIAREVIEPVTIEPGEAYAFTMVLGD